MKLLKNLLRTFKKFKVILIFYSIFFFSCGGGGGNTPVLQSNSQTSNLTFSWEVVSPESQGLSSSKVTAAMNFAMEDGRYTQAAIIIKNGKIVAEQYRGILTNEINALVNHAQTSCTADLLHTIYGARDTNSFVSNWTVAKSITSILFGIAQGQVYFSGSLDTTAATYLTEWANDSKNTITIKNLLDMRSINRTQLRMP